MKPVRRTTLSMSVCVEDPECCFLHWYLESLWREGISGVNAIILSCLPSGLWEQISRLWRLAPCLTQSCFRHSMQLGDLAKCTEADFTKQGSDGWISFPQSFHSKMFQATIKYHYVISFPVRPTRLWKCPPITSKGLAAGSPQYWQLWKEHKCYA